MIILALAMITSGCENLATGSKFYKENVNINILNVEFASDYKYMYANVQMSDSMTALLFENDTTIRFEAQEVVKGEKYDARTQPELTGYENIRLQELAKLNLDIMVLADLTLDSADVRKQGVAIRNLKNRFALRDMRIAFMKNKSVTATMDATDYVLDNYFKPDHGEKYLYRSIIRKMRELQYSTLTARSSTPADTVGRDFRPEQKVMIIFSNGKVYDDDNRPVDPNHFNLQHKIAQISDSTNGISVIYINLKKTPDETSEARDALTDSTDEEAKDILTVLCEKTGGKYLDTFDQNMVLKDLLMQDEDYADYRFTFVNPDLKIYRGLEHKLQINCYQNDSIIASDYITYNVGSVYNPVIINGYTTFHVILQGTILGLLTIFALYLIFQIVIPAIQYLIFKRKYIIRYTNKNMSYNGILVNRSCYLCKAPFVEGDKIVVKCQHVMHESCWNENEYKCPEYGKNCKHGRHYYNRTNILDPHNASFYLSWIIAGAIAGLVSWISFTSNAHNNDNLLLVRLIHRIFNLDPTSPQTPVLMDEYGGHLFYLPFYGMNIGFFLTLSLSLLNSHGRWLWKRLTVIAVKAIVGGLFGYLSFFIGCVISISLDFKDNSFLIDWVPWMLSGFAIAFVVAYGTDIKLKKALVGAAISIVFGLSSMYLWSFAFSAQIDTREFLLLSYMLYCIGFSISVAATSPKSERYFLRVEGPIKEMDIAIYKWMNVPTRPKHITIGKSVNCDLQMTWDITSPISPEQAEVTMINGDIYLVALDEGVTFNKEALKPNVKKRLYHGSKFVIGKTTFTYIEKDL